MKSWIWETGGIQTADLRARTHLLLAEQTPTRPSAQPVRYGGRRTQARGQCSRSNGQRGRAVIHPPRGPECLRTAAQPASQTGSEYGTSQDHDGCSAVPTTATAHNCPRSRPRSHGRQPSSLPAVLAPRSLERLLVRVQAGSETHSETPTNLLIGAWPVCPKLPPTTRTGRTTWRLNRRLRTLDHARPSSIGHLGVKGSQGSNLASPTGDFPYR